MCLCRAQTKTKRQEGKSFSLFFSFSPSERGDAAFCLALSLFSFLFSPRFQPLFPATTLFFVTPSICLQLLFTGASHYSVSLSLSQSLSLSLSLSPQNKHTLRFFFSFLEEERKKGGGEDEGKNCWFFGPSSFSPLTLPPPSSKTRHHRLSTQRRKTHAEKREAPVFCLS